MGRWYNPYTSFRYKEGKKFWRKCSLLSVESLSFQQYICICKEIYETTKNSFGKHLHSRPESVAQISLLFYFHSRHNKQVKGEIQLEWSLIGHFQGFILPCSCFIVLAKCIKGSEAFYIQFSANENAFWVGKPTFSTFTWGIDLPVYMNPFRK